MQAIGLVAQFWAGPKESHVNAVKRILKYLKGTMDFGLWYPRGEDFTLTSYTEVDWAGNTDDRKSTNGGAFFLSSIEPVCYQTLKDIKVQYENLIPKIYDNTSTINISKNLVMHSRTKHIPIKYHFLREQVLEQQVKLEYVATKEKVADIFNKPLLKENFKYLKEKLDVMSFASIHLVLQAQNEFRGSYSLTYSVSLGYRQRGRS